MSELSLQGRKFGFTLECAIGDAASEGDGAAEPLRWGAQNVHSAEVRHSRMPLWNACRVDNREVVEELRRVIEVIIAVDGMGREMIAIKVLSVAVSVRNLEPRVGKRTDSANVGPAVERTLDGCGTQADTVNDAERR